MASFVCAWRRTFLYKKAFGVSYRIKRHYHAGDAHCAQKEDVAKATALGVLKCPSPSQMVNLGS